MVKWRTCCCGHVHRQSVELPRPIAVKHGSPGSSTTSRSHPIRPRIGDGRIQVTVPASLAAGVHSVQVVHRRTVEAAGIEAASNVALIVLHPMLTAQLAGRTLKGAGNRPGGRAFAARAGAAQRQRFPDRRQRLPGTVGQGRSMVDGVRQGRRTLTASTFSRDHSRVVRTCS
jgi:hypothetical protein